MTTQAVLSTIPQITYGAPELKANYRKYFSRGLILAIAAHLLVIGIYLLINWIDKMKQDELLNEQKQQRIINITDLEPPPSATEDETQPPPKIEELTAAPPKDLTALTPEPVAKEKAEEQTIKTQQQLEEIKAPVSSMGDTGKFVYSGPVKVEEKKVEEKVEKIEKPVEKTIYKEFEVEKPPECVNLSQVRSMMSYPEIAIQANIEGRVSVKVLVGTDGNVIRVSSISGPDVFHDEVRSKAPNLKFTPGLQNGKPVKVWVTVPFNFRLKN
jgi:periplasmic protein TonB